MEDISLTHIARNKDCTFLESLKGGKSKIHVITIHPNDLDAVPHDQMSLNSYTEIRKL